MSAPEETLLLQIRAVGLPEPVREYKFALPRKWRFDFAWADRLLAVEVEGGVFVQGRHSRGGGFTADCEKYNTAAIRGWTVLRFTTAMITSGEAIKVIEEAFDD